MDLLPAEPDKLPAHANRYSDRLETSIRIDVSMSGIAVGAVLTKDEDTGFLRRISH